MPTTIKVIIEGGKASMTPALAQTLGPSGINPGQVLASINDKTREFAGISVPVSIVIDKASKSFEVEVGTPPVSSLVKAELGLKEPVKEEPGAKGKKNIGDLSFEQIVKIARMKKSSTLAKTLKSQVKEVLGTCLSLGASVEGKNPREVQREVDTGNWSEKLKE
ncbi:50S ribosomal protein L11 [Candidatus Micrarchaeota archaeon]|nr:50S ribosomal protein L11 [Candidatus Micrarchaeota archaeon]